MDRFGFRGVRATDAGFSSGTSVRRWNCCTWDKRIRCTSPLNSVPLKHGYRVLSLRHFRNHRHSEATLTECRLTIRSSRDRFAAAELFGTLSQRRGRKALRLNSGVRPQQSHLRIHFCTCTDLGGTP